ncbi:hypothetical protein GCM10018952_72340 [Streptosporangium vulgare]
MGALAAAMNVVRVVARSTTAAPAPRRGRWAGNVEVAGDVTEDMEGLPKL